MTRRLVVLAALTIVTVTLWAHSAFTQPSDEQNALRREVEKLKEGQATIQKDLEEIKNLLRARPTAAAPALREAVVSVDGAPFMGEKDAKVTMVDFTDYQ
jgi:protein-disulfide isomerase